MKNIKCRHIKYESNEELWYVRNVHNMASHDVIIVKDDDVINDFYL